MLFNSYAYLLAFLPLSVVGYFVLARHARFASFSLWALALASLVFYAFWEPRFLPLLLVSIAFNYLFGRILVSVRLQRRLFLALGIIANLLFLGFFKYVGIFAVYGEGSVLSLGLPLALSIFTLQQIIYLIDCYQDASSHLSLREYVLVTSFFPKLLIGPLVHAKEFALQLADSSRRVLNYRNINTGLFLIALGLFKKVVVADTFAAWANGGFDAGVPLTFVEAWVASLSFTLQLYFDLSGYFDMGIGSALLFNIKLPASFNAPYQALNLEDFWRRWNITLSDFFRDTVYRPLSRARLPMFRTGFNILAVFLLAAVWHGIALTFIVWGALHALGMMVLGLSRRFAIRIPALLSWGLTFLFVHVLWIFFRAPTLSDAFNVLSGLVGLNGISLPTFTSSYLSFLDPFVTFSGAFVQSNLHVHTAPVVLILWVLLGLFAVARLPDSMRLAERFRPNVFTFFLILGLFLVSFYNLTSVSEFIYFNI